MSAKYWLSLTGLVLAGTGYFINRLINYEPLVREHHISDLGWYGDRPLRIAQVSDFHGGSGIWSGAALGRIILSRDVDLVCITGDHFDVKYPPEESLDLLRSLAGKVPVFFVSGNNDEGDPRYSRLRSQITALGVQLLENEGAHLTMHNQNVSIYGVRDKSAYSGDDNWLWAVQQTLQSAEARIEDTAFRIVLGHRPEKTTLYHQLRKDLVMAGHAHGAQWQLPLLGGVLAPNQGPFPRYYHGVYRLGKEHPYHMVVSSGFDVHPFVPRFRNRPELVIVEIDAPR